MAIFHDLFGKKSKIESLDEVLSELDKEVEIFRDYCTNFWKKLELLKDFENDWSETKIRRMEKEVRKLESYEKKDIKVEKSAEKNVIKAVEEISKSLSSENNPKIAELETDEQNKLLKLFAKIEKLRENFTKQISFFDENDTLMKQNENKDELINLIEEESSIIFDLSDLISVKKEIMNNITLMSRKD